jgi:TolB-like protein/Flp pilus assembly protein TadD
VPENPSLPPGGGGSGALPGAERWQRLDALFDAALALPAEAREGFCGTACGDDGELRAELLSLLAAHEGSGILDHTMPALPEARPEPGGDSGPTATSPERPPSARLAAGSRLGPYEVVGLLGAGGMGEVYRARDPRLGREVAIKRVRGAEPDPEALRRFDHEARAAGALNHPNLLAVYDVGVESGMPYVVTELLEGETLRQRLRGGAVPLGETLGLLRQILSGLVAAHDKGIVHRDLKPENLFVTLDGRVKILDFGLAKRLGGSGGSGLDQSLTGAGQIVGTLGYTAPEQLRGQPAEPRSDLFALGAVLYEMLSGRRAFARATALETVGAVLGDEPPPVDAPQVPAGIERLLRRCLAKRPEERPGSAREILAELDAVGAGAAPEPPRGAPAVEPRSLAVLPFVDLSPQGDQGYFCDGIAEEVLDCVARISGLRVAARTSSFCFRGVEDVRRIGRDLDVEAVLEGSVRKAGERLRVSCRLVSTADGCQLWSARFDRGLEDVFAIQEEIAEAAARQLRGILTAAERQALRRGGTSNVRAYEWYLRGKELMLPFHEARRAREMFLRAVELDPGFALAWAGLANACAFLAQWCGEVDQLGEAERASARASELAPDLAETHVARGQTISLLRRWADADAAFARAVELDPRSFDAWYLWARACFVQGRAEEAARRFARAAEVRPEDYQALHLLALCQVKLGRHEDELAAYREAIARARRQIERDPGDARAYYLDAIAELRMGEREAAFADIHRALAIGADDPQVLHNAACFFSLAGESERALDLLERNVARGFGQRDWVENDPDFASLLDEPRFRALVVRMR